MQFLYDNHGPYLKIYFNENNMSSDYELFDRNQHDLPNYGTRDSLNNFLPNTQAQLPFQPMGQPSAPSKNPSIQSSVIHHLVSSLGPNKTGSYSPFGETIINNNSMPANFASAPPMMMNIPSQVQQSFHENIDMSSPRASVESSNPMVPTSNNVNNVTPGTNIKKARIVAEVKPMRMSYSDVVSKNGVIGQAASPTVGNTNSASSSPNTTLPVTTKNVKVDKSKFSSGNFDKKAQDGDKENLIKAKKSPINIMNLGNNTDSKRMTSIPGKADKPLSQGQPTKKRSSHGTTKETGSACKTSLNQSRAQKPKHASDSDDEDDDNSSLLDSDVDIEDVPIEFYNVRKNISHGEHHNIEKIVPTKGGTTTSYKKVKNASTGSSKKVEKVQKRTGKSTSRKRQKHEVLLKLCISWGEYLLKFVQWLWILIYDVGYLSCGIIWDRMSWCYQCAAQGVETVRQEINGSPGRAVWLWMKDLWKRFDGKFEKKSRWAFWRWLFKKKQATGEQVKDYYKDGKLPKTAEEAMKSLLNCKGKDAYRFVMQLDFLNNLLKSCIFSILGVSPNCSQEQIRKHYKKIAVLVHPDKNKQAGAEEAFKVLQRSFELIGEPVSNFTIFNCKYLITFCINFLGEPSTVRSKHG